MHNTNVHTHRHTHVQIQDRSYNTQHTQQSAAGCHTVQDPAENVYRSRMHTVKISLRLTPSAEYFVLYSKTLGQTRTEKKKNVRRKTENCLPQGQSTWCEGQPNHSTPLSPPLQITGDTRVKEESSNEGRIICNTEAMPTQHYITI